MEEQNISFETAKLLKEKGIEQKSYPIYVYPNKVGNEPYLTTIHKEHFNEDNTYYAPTQTQLQKCLRDVYKIDVIALPIRFFAHEEIGYWTYAVKSIQPVGKIKYKYDSYEEALEQGLIEGLKLI